MNTLTPTATDPRLAAFLSNNAPEVFHAVAEPNATWQLDPYDVPTIHQEARETFANLLRRARRQPPPTAGSILVLKGNAGSGKTHLLHTFHSKTHSEQSGYCAYMHLTAEAGNYGRYLLNGVIDCLRKPYTVNDPFPNCLTRIASHLLDAVPRISHEQRTVFRAGQGETLRLVDEYADHLKAEPAYGNCDLELMRVLLHLQRGEPRASYRVEEWLRCKPMRDYDLPFIGHTFPRLDEAEPMRMLQNIAALIGAVDHVPLLLFVDQLEDMFHQTTPIEQYLRVIDSLITYTEHTPNGIVILSCLEDFFVLHNERLSRSKQDRLKNPLPIRLQERRGVDEIQSLASNRLKHLYQTQNVTYNADEPFYPFTADDLKSLENFFTRSVLGHLLEHHQKCIALQRWEKPDWVIAPPPPPPPPPPTPSELQQLWLAHTAKGNWLIPDDEESLAKMLAAAIHALSAELPTGFQVGCSGADGLYVEVDVLSPIPTPNKLLVAVCNKPSRSLGKQIESLSKRVGDFPVAIVRTTDFPKTPTSAVVKAITKILGAHGRRVVVSDADWKVMRHFEEFRKEHGQRDDFLAWQQANRPLSQLKGLQEILRLNIDETATVRPAVKPVAPPPPVEPIAVKPIEPVKAKEPVDVKPQPVAIGETLHFGQALSLTAPPITFEPKEFTQHAAFLGGTGSGKTTAALNLIEQLLERGIPALLVDRKGDLCRYADPVAWNRALNDPRRVESRTRLRSQVDVAIYTPGEPNGRPLTLPIVPTGFAQLAPSDRERFAQYAAGAMGSMLGFKPTNETDKAQLAILTNAIAVLGSVAGLEITLTNLRRAIRDQDAALMDAIGDGYPKKHFEALAQRLQTLELNNRLLLQGNESLDIDALLGTGPYAQPGRTKLSVISTRFLGDTAKIDFWVAQLLVALTRWCARAPKPSLQAVLMFDEADQYLPAIRQPATKAPMEDLLKRARSAGVGVFLATQSPGDLDYKCRENVQSWFLGRISQQRAIEKLQPLFAGAKSDPSDKLAGQNTGEFFVVRPANTVAAKSQESLIRTEQLPEDLIAKLACNQVQLASPPRSMELMRSS